MKTCLFGMMLAVVALAQAPMFNEDVMKMVAAGTDQAAIIAAIRASQQPRFNLIPAYMEQMGRAGVSDDIIKAMAAKQFGQSTHAAMMPPVPVAQRLVAPSVPRLPKPRPEHWGMTPGMPEVGISGGVACMEPT